MARLKMHWAVKSIDRKLPRHRVAVLTVVLCRFSFSGEQLAKISGARLERGPVATGLLLEMWCGGEA